MNELRTPQMWADHATKLASDPITTEEFHEWQASKVTRQMLDYFEVSLMSKNSDLSSRPLTNDTAVIAVNQVNGFAQAVELLFEWTPDQMGDEV